MSKNKANIPAKPFAIRTGHISFTKVKRRIKQIIESGMSPEEQTEKMFALFEDYTSHLQERNSELAQENIAPRELSLKIITHGVKDAIKEHGPITNEFAFSASKRIYGHAKRCASSNSNLIFTDEK